VHTCSASLGKSSGRGCERTSVVDKVQALQLLNRNLASERRHLLPWCHLMVFCVLAFLDADACVFGFVR